MPANYSSNDLSTTGNLTASSAVFTNSSIGIGNIFDGNGQAFGIIQEDPGQNILVGSLDIYNGLSAPTVIYKPMPPLSPGYLGGNISISYSIHKQIQKLRIGAFSFNNDGQLEEGNVNFVLGGGWPTENAPVAQFSFFYSGVSVDVLLELEIATNCTVIWDIVDEWYSQPPPTFTQGTKHLVLLRSFGTQFLSYQSEPGVMPTIVILPVIQGHYIGQKTN
jgi:hypothetical protein